MKTWKYRKIGDICSTIVSGGTPSRNKAEYYGGDVKWLKTKELNDTNIYDTEEKITETGLRNSSAKVLPIDTISMAMYGATIGKLGILKSEMSTNQACCNMVLNSDNNFQFLFYSLLNSRSQIISQGSGAAQQNLSVGKIKEFDILLPDLQEQEEVASILLSLDDKIEISRKMNEVLEQMGQTLYRHWFVDFEFPWDFEKNEFSWDGKPYKSSGGEVVESELGEIPKGWEYDLLKNQFKLTVGGIWGDDKKTDSNSYAVRCLKGSELEKIEKGEMVDATLRWIKPTQYAARALKAGDVLIEGSGSFCGRSLVITDDILKLYNQDLTYTNFCKRLRPNKDINLSFILRFNMIALHKSGGINNYRTGAAFPNFDVDGMLNDLHIIIPDSLVLTEFSTFFKNTRASINQAVKQNIQLSQIRDLLLPRLMSGKLRVPVEK